MSLAKSWETSRSKRPIMSELEQELSNGGYKITTTINQKIHNAMQNAVANYGRLDDRLGSLK